MNSLIILDTDIIGCMSTFHNTILNPKVLTGHNYFVVSNDLEDLKDLKHLFMETFTGYLDE